MGEEQMLGGYLYAVNESGEYEKVMPFSEIETLPTIDARDTANPAEDIWGVTRPFNEPIVLTGKIKYFNSKIFERLFVWGWRAKGPIRKRLVNKLWKEQFLCR